MDSMPRSMTFAALLLILTSNPIIPAENENDPWLPESLNGFIHAMEMALEKKLTPEELAEVRRLSPDELREFHPELHEKIQRSFKPGVGNTESWRSRSCRKNS